MAPPAIKNSKLETAAILILVAVLMGSIFLLKKLKPDQEEYTNTGKDESLFLPRPVDPKLVGFVELEALTPKAKKMRGLALDNSDRLWLFADFKAMRLNAEGETEFAVDLDDAPYCGAFAPNGKLYLGTGSQVTIFDPQDKSVKKGSSFGENTIIRSIAMGKLGGLVGDGGSKSVHLIDLEGASLMRISDPPGTAPSVHFDVAADPDGAFWATDAGRFAVNQYGLAGNLLNRWGKAGQNLEDFGGCCNPSQIATLPDGRLVLGEKKPDLIKICHPDGTLDTIVAPPNAFLLKTFIADIATDSKGRIYIIDPKRKKIRIFEAKHGN